MDLESTLIRAEALFRKFQRVVEAVDKKDNFPAPRLNPKPTNDDSSSKGKGKGKTSVDKEPATPFAERAITPELRKLLEKNVEILPRKTVAQKGEGMPGK